MISAALLHSVNGLKKNFLLYRDVLVFIQAGCIREAQSWELMIKSMQGTNKEAAWSKQVGFKIFRGGTD